MMKTVSLLIRSCPCISLALKHEQSAYTCTKASTANSLYACRSSDLVIQISAGSLFKGYCGLLFCSFPTSPRPLDWSWISKLMSKHPSSTLLKPPLLTHIISWALSLCCSGLLKTDVTVCYGRTWELCCNK